MSSADSVNVILDYLDKKYTSKDKRNAFFRECKKNLGLETACIAACELGEFGSEVLAYKSGLDDINTPGLLGGITLGMLYSLAHVYRHGREHSKKASLRDAFNYALSTESACVVSATAVEYFLGLATSQDPFSPTNLAIRGAGLVPAFALGLTAMSAVSYLQGQEAGRFLGGKQALSSVQYEIWKSMGADVSLSKNRLKIQGGRSHLVVSEHKVPKSLREDSSDSSLYIVRSPVCRYDSASREPIRESVEDIFRTSGFEVREVHNVFRH